MLLATTAGAPISPASGRVQAPSESEVQVYEIRPQALSEALADFGQQSGRQVSVAAEKVRGLSSPGVTGRMTAAQALSRLLAGSGLTYRLSDDLVTLEKAPPVVDRNGLGQPIVTETLQVEGTVEASDRGAERDTQRHDAVYDLDASSTFAGKTEVDSYKGATPSDVLKGMVNVFSGDARNSGALDPSIRGIQGPGRVPVIIDGTEQALTVWRGYNGASNRSYVDPSLIAGVQVMKGPVSQRGINGSTGGAVVLTTLGTDDLLKPGETFALELKLEGGDNSTSPRTPRLRTGEDYRTVAGFPGTPGAPGMPNLPYADPTLRVALRTAGENDLLSFGDKAARLALAGRIGDVDLVGAYAWRERGNYFSGKRDAGYYRQADLEVSPDTYVRTLALNYKPGNEVPNTSSRMESRLVKGSWRIAAGQSLQLGFRDSRSRYGEIFPSRIISSFGFGDVQWPLSKVHAQTYNADYKRQPGGRWIDLKASLWATHTVSDTYSAGGFPNTASVQDPILINTALSNARNNRFGLTASNQMKLSSRFDLLLEGNWQHEKLGSDDQYNAAIADGWRQYPRAGRREEYSIRLSAEWRPTSRLKLNAGLGYTGYWARDDFLAKLIRINGGSIEQLVTANYSTAYRTEESGSVAYAASRRSFWEDLGLPPEMAELLAAGEAEAYAASPFPFTVDHEGPLWQPDAQGDYRRADNICANGSLDSVAGYTGWCAVTANAVPVAITQAKRKSARGWAPTASATVYFNGSSRVYLRYAQAYRFPSMFESTIGFSTSINPQSRLKPEHTRSWEAAYVHDLRDLFGLGQADQHADVKLTWYGNTTRNVIDRGPGLTFFNLDRQEIAGLELQARYDDGRFFTELGAAHMTKNKTCDASFAILKDPTAGRVSDCSKYGFAASYLLTQATPEDSINWSVGGRFFDRRLEIGGRLIWYSAYANPHLDRFTAAEGDDQINGYGLNIPYAWGEILTLDLHASYRLNDRITAELAGTNLTDRYYLDPLTRSLNPAPGRTVRLSLTGRF